jgi:hypothetical protein
MAAAAGGAATFDGVCARVRELRSSYEPPDFAHVRDPDAALFLCAIDHRTGYERAHRVDGEGPLEGSELLWAAGLSAARARPGLLTADGLSEVSAGEVAAVFEVDGETVADPERRAALWRDLAQGLARDHGGSADRVLASAEGRLGGAGGLLELLSAYEAYSDPLAKKSQLFAKICARRGWFEVSDPESWEVSADNVLMRLALRSGLVEPGELDEVRATTRDAFKRVALATGLPPPELDDMLWELGRDDPDLLGSSAGDLREPARDPRSAWY